MIYVALVFWYTNEALDSLREAELALWYIVLIQKLFTLSKWSHLDQEEISILSLERKKKSIEELKIWWLLF